MLGPNHWNCGDKINFQELANIFGEGFPCGSAGKESACNVGDLGSVPGLGRSPGEGKRLPTPLFWPGEFHGQYSPRGHKESDMTERLSLSHLEGWQAAVKAAVFTTIPPILLACNFAFHRWWVQKWGLGNFNYAGITRVIPTLDFPYGSAGKESACNAGDLDSIPGLGRSPGEGKGYPIQYSGLENSMDYSPCMRKESNTTQWLSLPLSYLHYKPYQSRT